MIVKNLYLSSSLLFFSLFLFVGSSFAQDCADVTLDSIDNPGEYTFGSLTEADGIRNGPSYAGATIYYPENAAAPYAGMVIVPGFVSPQSSIQNWGPFLASHGIATMTIGTNSLFDQPEDRRDALLDAMITLAEENTRPDSPLFSNLDVNSMAVGGWSMGGGGAQLAAAADPNIKAAMALCPWLNTLQLTPALLDHEVPLLIFSGENDAVAPAGIHADVHYDYTPESTNKMIFEIDGGDHSVANDPIGGDGYVGKIAVSWLKHFLVGDDCYCPLVLDTPPTASNYLLSVECTEAVSVDDFIASETTDFQLYPNPTTGNINLEVKNLDPGTNYQIFSMQGAQIFTGKIVSKSSKIPLPDLAPGIYIFNLNSDKSSTQTRFIVQ